MSVTEASFIKPQVVAIGPTDADIMIVGEAPGENEVKQGIPFVGSSGQEMDRMLNEAGILRNDCFITNVCSTRPQGNKIDKYYLVNTPKNRVPGPEIVQGIKDLQANILQVRPKVIIAFGDTALWALTGERGIVKWRGSQMEYYQEDFSCTVLPSYHPAAILRQWSWRFAGVIDLRRAARELITPTKVPPYDFLLRPSFEEAMDALDAIPAGPTSVDIETRGGHIACIGFGTSRLHAFCIPFMCVENTEGYWSKEEEFHLVMKLRQVLTREDIQFILQNGLYDVQYIARFWGVVPEVYMDTMLAQHVAFAGLPKGLDFLSSIYCEYHRYWKDESKDWDPHVGEDQLWEYNCKDCVTTLEAAEELEKHIDKLGLKKQLDFQMKQFPAVFWMMLRGIKCDLSHKNDLIMQLDAAKTVNETWINAAIGREFNVRSHPQVKKFMYQEMGSKPIKNRKTGSITSDDAAIETVIKRIPVLKPFLSRLQETRSIGVFLSTFARMPLDRDNRIRCYFNIAGTETYRYSSGKNAFGSGTNLQNIPPGDEDSKGSESRLPNIKRIFCPDLGQEFFDADLKGADAQVVAWEAHDELLKQMFREGVNIHFENAKLIFANERLKEGCPEQQLAKVGVHATDYGANARTLAWALGITVRKAEEFQMRWFSAHPRIPEWHLEVENSLQTTRAVSNKFGFRRYYFDRIEGLLPEALAWIPQSTVALVMCQGLVAIHETLPEVQCLIQVHDSLGGQYPTTQRGPMLRAIKDCLEIEIPYDDPLTIPIELKISRKSYGDCEKYALAS